MTSLHWPVLRENWRSYLTEKKYQCRLSGGWSQKSHQLWIMFVVQIPFFFLFSSCDYSIASQPVMNNECQVSSGINRVWGVSDLLLAPRPCTCHLFLPNCAKLAGTVLHVAHGLTSVFFITGMLTITDFIIILHRYYKSPMVGPPDRWDLPVSLRIFWFL